MAQLSSPMPGDARSDYVTIAEAAAELHCHERTIRRAIDRGRSPRRSYPRRQRIARLLTHPTPRPRRLALHRVSTMPRKARREPIVEVRRRCRHDGTWSETPTVRYYDELGARRRQS